MGDLGFIGSRPAWLLDSRKTLAQVLYEAVGQITLARAVVGGQQPLARVGVDEGMAYFIVLFLTEEQAVVL